MFNYQANFSWAKDANKFKKRIEVTSAKKETKAVRPIRYLRPLSPPVTAPIPPPPSIQIEPQQTSLIDTFYPSGVERNTLQL
jgi:hypothetical protein